MPYILANLKRKSSLEPQFQRKVGKLEYHPQNFVNRTAVSQTKKLENHQKLKRQKRTKEEKFLIAIKEITSRQTRGLHSLQSYNLQKVRDKLTKLSKIGLSMECFTTDFLRFFTKKCQNLTFGWTAGYSPSNPSISGIFRKFPNFLNFSLKS